MALAPPLQNLGMLDRVLPDDEERECDAQPKYRATQG
jgi:hypothetical protein